MKFKERVLGTELTKSYKELNNRVALLPADYQQAWEQIAVKVWTRSDFTGRNILPLLTGVVDMMEELSSIGQSAEQTFGADIEGFCNELTIDQPTYDYQVKAGQKLNKKISKYFRLED